MSNKKAATTTCAVTGLSNAKRAALLFDQIALIAPLEDRDGPSNEVVANYPKEIVFLVFNSSYLKHAENRWTLPVALTALQDQGYRFIPISGSHEIIDNIFPFGSHAAYQASLDSIPMILDEENEWSQIIDFRKDKDSLRMYRSFHKWINSCMQATSADEAIDIIGTKLDQYEWAIRKHGLKTVIGSVSVILDADSLAKIIVGASTTGLFGGPLWAAITSGLLVGGQVAMQVANKQVDLQDIKRGENSEIAYLYKIKEKFE
tara:strand:+ start:120 stop:902 length:783 start_codon:yes stop_codon:yes gene_type:complete